MEPLLAHLLDRCIWLLLAVLASGYLLDCWLYGSLFARCRGYCEARWPSGPLSCRLCLGCWVATALVSYLHFAEGVWKLPIVILAVAWGAVRFSSVPDNDHSSL